MVVFEQNVYDKLNELIQYLQNEYKTEQSAIRYGQTLFSNVTTHIDSIATYRRSNNPKFYFGLPIYQVNEWCFPYKENKDGSKTVLDMVHYKSIAGGLMENKNVFILKESQLRRIIRESINRILDIA